MKLMVGRVGVGNDNDDDDDDDDDDDESRDVKSREDNGANEVCGSGR